MFPFEPIEFVYTVYELVRRNLLLALLRKALYEVMFDSFRYSSSTESALANNLPLKEALNTFCY